MYRGVNDVCLSCDQGVNEILYRPWFKVTSWSIWVSNVQSTEKAFPNSNVFGEAPSGRLTELLSTRPVVHSTQDQLFTFVRTN